MPAVFARYRPICSRIRDQYGLLSAVRQMPALLRETNGMAALAIGSAPPVYLRPDSIDIVVHDEVFRDGCYAVDLPEPPQFIVDAGANIGLTSVYFAHRYPHAT